MTARRILKTDDSKPQIRNPKTQIGRCGVMTVRFDISDFGSEVCYRPFSKFSFPPHRSWGINGLSFAGIVGSLRPDVQLGPAFRRVDLHFHSSPLAVRQSRRFETEDVLRLQSTSDFGHDRLNSSRSIRNTVHAA